MTYFDDLRPYLIREDLTTSQNNNSDTLKNDSKLTTRDNPPNVPGIPPLPAMEHLSMENILRMHIGKSGKFHFMYHNHTECINKVYRGVIEQVGHDYLVIHDPTTNKRYLLRLSSLDWAEFDEALHRQLPYV